MRSLDRCEHCQVGRMKVYTTRTIGVSRIRYLKCDHCHTTDQEVLRVDELGRSIILTVGTFPSTNTRFITSYEG